MNHNGFDDPITAPLAPVSVWRVVFAEFICVLFFLFRFRRLEMNLVHLQRPSESVPTDTLPCCLIAGAPGPTLALLQTALPKGACWTRLLAVASYEPWRTLARPLHGITESSVLTLALLTAAWAPVFIITGWKVRGQLIFIYCAGDCSRLCCSAKMLKHNLIPLFICWKDELGFEHQMRDFTDSCFLVFHVFIQEKFGFFSALPHTFTPGRFLFSLPTFSSDSDQSASSKTPAPPNTESNLLCNTGT